MTLAVVVQRYGADINGGAELHARYIAERLSQHASVEVITTCARDYVTWKNELPAGIEQVNGIAVRRFPVAHERRPDDFGRRSHRVFEQRHSIADELAWLESEGPASPALLRYIEQHAAAYDFVLLFSARYYHAWHLARRIPDKALIVPTAERDPAVALAIFGPAFRGVRALMYNSAEERAMINAAAGNEAVPGIVVGVGSEVPDRTDGERFRQRFRLQRPFAIYVGRIDANKGCTELFSHFQRYATAFPRGMDLVLIGSAILDVPRHPRIHHLGFLDDRDKFDALAASDLLIMPSYFESLSMVALEAWALGKPVLANGRCDVLKGQCIRSNAGLYYESYEEFVEALYSLESNGPLNTRLGRNGREFFRRHYSWPVIEQKYLEMFERLQAEDASRSPAARANAAGRLIEPLPGILARRRRDIPPARELLDRIPAGPVVDADRMPDAGRQPAAARSRAGGADVAPKPLRGLGGSSGSRRSA
jgi:glycosyltransferase involved in cell wall biosynthesis